MIEVVKIRVSPATVNFRIPVARLKNQLADCWPRLPL